MLPGDHALLALPCVKHFRQRALLHAQAAIKFVLLLDAGLSLLPIKLLFLLHLLLCHRRGSLGAACPSCKVLQYRLLIICLHRWVFLADVH